MVEKYKLQQGTNNQFFLNLPSSLIHAKDWKKGDMINIKINEKGKIVLDKD